MALAVSGQTRIHWESSARGALRKYFQRKNSVTRRSRIRSLWEWPAWLLELCGQMLFCGECFRHSRPNG
jgi:hypothetical protein